MMKLSKKKNNKQNYQILYVIKHILITNMNVKIVTKYT